MNLSIFNPKETCCFFLVLFVMNAAHSLGSHSSGRNRETSEQPRRPRLRKQSGKKHSIPFRLSLLPRHSRREMKLRMTRSFFATVVVRLLCWWWAQRQTWRLPIDRLSFLSAWWWKNYEPSSVIPQIEEENDDKGKRTCARWFSSRRQIFEESLPNPWQTFVVLSNNSLN